MKAYLTDAGATLLQNAQATGTPITLSGAQIGTSYGFVPDSSLTIAQGAILVDKATDPSSVKLTPVHTHEMIFTVYLDQTYDFPQMGNVLLFANNVPFLWSVSSAPFGKLQTNPITHFAGDEYFFGIVMRYPYLQSLVAFDTANSLGARFRDYAHIYQVPVAAHCDTDQIFVEQNDLWFGGGKPFFAARAHGTWFASPIIMPLDDTGNFGVIDGGSNLTGV